MALEAIFARERYALLMDSWTELFEGVVGGDPLDFPGYAEKMAAQLAERMRAGEIAAAPLCGKGGKGPCEYCEYAAICRQDAGRAPQNAQALPEMRFDELLERINAEKSAPPPAGQK